MAVQDAIPKLNALPTKTNKWLSPHVLFYGKSVDVSRIVHTPFGAIVMAHVAPAHQTGFSGASRLTYAIGSPPDHQAGGLLLFNPMTLRYMARRSFKIVGPVMPDSTPPILTTTDDYRLFLQSPHSLLRLLLIRQSPHPQKALSSYPM